jgi:hypothetical protein
MKNRFLDQKQTVSETENKAFYDVSKRLLIETQKLPILTKT